MRTRIFFLGFKEDKEKFPGNHLNRFTCDEKKGKLAHDKLSEPYRTASFKIKFDSSDFKLSHKQIQIEVAYRRSQNKRVQI